MNVAWIGGTRFKSHGSMDLLAMLSLFRNMKWLPTNFYFVNENQFSKMVYRECKDYKKNHPGSKLIYVADPSKKEDIKQGKYDLFVYPEEKSAPPHLSVQEKYAIEHSDWAIIYNKDGLEGNIAAFYTLFSEKELVDYSAYLNQFSFSIHTTTLITDELIHNYDERITEPHEYVKNVFFYLHVHQELLETFDCKTTYLSALAYLFKRYFKHLCISQYDSKKSKEAILAAADICCKKYVEKNTFLLDQNGIIRFAQYCQSHGKLISDL